MQVELIRFHAEEVVVVRVAGEVDIATVATLADRLDEVVREAPRAVICDLREVSYFGMAAAHCLEQASDALQVVRGQLHLVVTPEPTPVLRLMSPIWGWPTHHDVRAAVHSVAARPART